MNQESVWERQQGLVLFFVYFIIEFIISRTHLPVLIAQSYRIRGLVLFCAFAAMICAWLSLFRRNTLESRWSHTCALVSALSISLSILMLFFFIVPAPRSWEGFVYEYLFRPWLGGNIVFKGAAVLGAFFSRGWTRYALAISVALLTIIW